MCSRDSSHLASAGRCIMGSTVYSIWCPVTGCATSSISLCCETFFAPLLHSQINALTKTMALGQPRRFASATLSMLCLCPQVSSFQKVPFLCGCTLFQSKQGSLSKAVQARQCRGLLMQAFPQQVLVCIVAALMPLYQYQQSEGALLTLHFDCRDIQLSVDPLCQQLHHPAESDPLM